MINVIQVISEMVEQWDYESKCDLCWQFSAPLRISDLNEWQSRDDKECCVLVAVTDYTFECFENRNRQTGLRGLGSFTHDFTLHFLSHDNLGVNVYDEIKGHPLSESKWDTILWPILDCISCNAFDWCLNLGYQIEVSRWRGSAKIDYLDDNYSGWSVSVQLRENNLP